MRFDQPKWSMILGLSLVLILAGTWHPSAKGCTIAVVSGKATEDGRPILWKNRDTESRRNLVRVFTDGKYRVTAVIDAGHSEAIWMGMNDQGLCLVNSLSLDLPRGNRVGRGNGRFMKLALQSCASAADFERLLLDTNENGRRTRANFGVIDSEGGAVLFEVGHREFAKFDANDAEAHPEGFIVRSNFSMTATGTKPPFKSEKLLEVYSGRRYLRANAIIESYLKQNDQLDYRFFLRTLCRDISNEIDAPICRLDDKDFSVAQNLFPTGRIDTRSTINRRNTVSAVVFHGVKPGSNPQWTTMWTLLGEPAFALAVPSWTASSHLPEQLNGPERSALCATAREIRAINYDSESLLNTRRLQSIWSQTLALESRFVIETEKQLQIWRQRNQKPQPEELDRYQERLAKTALDGLLKLNSKLQSQPALAEKPSIRQLTQGEPGVLGD